MTPDALDRALAALPADDDITPGRGVSVPAIGNILGTYDYASLIERFEVRDDIPPDPPRRTTAPPCVPARYAVGPKQLRGWISPAIWRAVEATVPEIRYGVLLLGPSGCGKSSAAAYLVQRWRSRAHAGSVCWLDAIEATDAERRYRLGDGDPAWLTEASRADWLVLDDVGKATATATAQLLLARRYAQQLPTIVTTGLERPALVEQLGAATVRRIVEYEGRERAILVDAHGGQR